MPPMPPGWPPKEPHEIEEPDDDMVVAWDLVDEASWESFPASDPPSYTQHRVLGTCDDRLPDPETMAAHRLVRWLGAAGLVLVAGGAALAVLRALRR